MDSNAITNNIIILEIFLGFKTMGVYRSEPETSKNTHEGSNDKMVFVSAEMQGTH